MKSTYIFSSTFECLSHPERPGRRYFRNLHFRIYTKSDLAVEAPDLTYGSATESLDLMAFNAFNGTRSSKTAFTLNYDGVPIFEKVFDPSQSSILDPVTGIFSIDDHFFSTGERLTYTPNTGLPNKNLGVDHAFDAFGYLCLQQFNLAKPETLGQTGYRIY